MFHTKISTPISTQEKTAGKNFRQNIAGEQVHIVSAAPPARRFETSWRVVCWGLAPIMLIQPLKFAYVGS